MINLCDNENMLKISNKISVIVFSLIISASIETASAAESYTFTRDITLGSHGADVSALQQILIDSGFLKITTPTGYFGPLTKNKLSEWQASVGISPASGFFGPISRNKISVANTQVATTTKTATALVHGCTSLVGFSGATGEPCGASSKALLIPGCVSTVGFSSSTGQACSGAATLNVALSLPLPTQTQTISTSPISNGNGSPVRIKIPKINVDAGFQYNGLTSDGTMEIPNNVVDVGWFTGSVHPGERGTSVITGHVAQIRGGVLTKPGVFFTLRDLRAGDTLAITNDKGESTTFIVRETRNFDPSADATDVFTSNDNGAHLNIITCEGTWHPDQLSYSQRLVVFTDAVK